MCHYLEGKQKLDVCGKTNENKNIARICNRSSEELAMATNENKNFKYGSISGNKRIADY